MISKRKWSTFPSRFKENIDKTTGLLGLGGVVLGVVALPVVPALAATAFIALGGTIVVSALGHATYMAVPPKLVPPISLINTKIALSDLDRLDRRIPKIAIVGLSKAGKTTLRNRFSFFVEETDRTNFVTAQIVSFPTNPASFAAFMDGGGHIFQQQFEMCEACDILCVVLDHNTSETDQAMDVKRVQKNRDFIEQIAHSIKLKRKNSIALVLFLWNKRDLWQADNSAKNGPFLKFQAEIERVWLLSNLATECKFLAHSNNFPDDIGKVLGTITTAATEWSKKIGA